MIIVSRNHGSRHTLLQVLGCEGAKDVVEEYQKNPDADFHSIVANIANIERDQAKTINLRIILWHGR